MAKLRVAEVMSRSVQDYLQAIYRLGASQTPVNTTVLAAHLGVAPASVTAMLRKMHQRGLVEHTPYQGAKLTSAGHQEALQLLRRHRLWELFLTQALGLAWDEVHEEAHRLEHATSERVADRLAAFLDEPEADPHGQRIPSRDGILLARVSFPLSELQPGQTARVVEVPDGDPSLLRQFGQWGVIPGARLTILGEEALQGRWRIQVDDRFQVVPQDALKGIEVELA